MILPDQRWIPRCHDHFIEAFFLKKLCLTIDLGFLLIFVSKMFQWSFFSQKFDFVTNFQLRASNSDIGSRVKIFKTPKKTPDKKWRNYSSLCKLGSKLGLFWRNTKILNYCRRAATFFSSQRKKNSFVSKSLTNRQ